MGDFFKGKNSFRENKKKNLVPVISSGENQK